MALKILLIALVILLGVVVVIPFVLNIAGIEVFQFGSIGTGGVSAGGTILRSHDAGENWMNVSLSVDRRSSFPSQILDIIFHPRDPDILFLGSKGDGLWKSGDGGMSWQKVIDASNVLTPKSDVYRVAVSPSRPEFMYLAVFQDGRGRVLRSEDGGKSFREIYFVTANRTGVFDLFIDPFDANHLRVVTGQGGFLETRNSGRTWQVRKWFSEALTHLLVNPFNSREMYVLTSRNRLWKTVDGGENWTELNYTAESLPQNQSLQVVYPPPGVGINPFGGFGRRSLEDFLIDPNDPRFLYIGSREGLLRSENGGFLWERLNVLIPPEALPVSAVAIYPKNSQIIFAAAANQLHRSDDGGRNWSVKILPTSSRVRKLLLHPTRPEVMFVVLDR